MSSKAVRFTALVTVVLGAGVAGRGPLSTAVDRTVSEAKASRAPVTQASGNLPVSFAPNRGQLAQGIDFVAQGAGYGLALGPTGAVLSLTHAGASREVKSPPATTAVTMELLGGDPASAAQSQEPLRGRVNYLTGSDPRGWHTDLPTFGRVTYPRVYPGVDVTYYGNQGSLEYDFVVAPGSDPAQIAIGFQGSRSISLAPDGELVVAVPGGELRQPAPRLYQGLGSTKSPIQGKFVIRGDNQVGFEVGEFDRSRPLVIDPVLGYSTYLGGSRADLGQGIAVDGQGYAYVAGGTSSAGFPATAGAQDTTYDGEEDGFVTKLAPDGSLIYSTFLGGMGTDDADTLAVDASGSVYVRGITTSPDFPATPGAFDTTFNGGFDAYLAKLSPDGSSLAFSSFLGGGGFDSGSGLAVDAAGSAYVVGITGSPEFPTTPGAFGRAFHGVGGPLPPPVGPGDFDAFATKFTPDGSALAYSTFLGGERLDVAFKVAIDTTGQAALAGLTLSADYPTTPLAYDTSFGGGFIDAYVTKLSADGSALVYSTFLGGSGPDGALGVDMEPNGAVHVTGSTSSPDFPTTPGAYDTTINGEQDAFVAKLSPNGSNLRFSTFLGGSGMDQGTGLAVDPNGATYVTGQTKSGDLPTTPGAYNRTFNRGSADAFVAKLSPAGTSLAFSSFLGGTAADIGNAIDVGPDGAAFVTGSTRSSDFPTTPGAFDPTFNGATDAFVTRVNIGGGA